MNKEWRTHTTPEEKYRNCPQYHQLVDVMRNMIRQAEFTSSELREAALFAAIIEERYNSAPPIMPFEREIP